MILNSPTISGSLTVTGNIIASGSITLSGSVASASYAANAELLDGLDSTQFTLTSSFAAQTASFTAFTASILSYTSSQNILNGKYATTSSNTFTGIQTINSNLVVTGSITAQTLVVQTITSSVDFVTGSTRFGSISANTHIFTGSVSISGSLSGSSAAFIGSVTSDDLILTAGTLFGTGNTGFSNRLSDTTLYLQMPASGFNITDNALNTKVIISNAGAATFYSSVTAATKLSVGTSSTLSGVDMWIHSNSSTNVNVARLALTTDATGHTVSDGSWIHVENTGLYIDNYENDAIIFSTNTLERMRVTSNVSSASLGSGGVMKLLGTSGAVGVYTELQFYTYNSPTNQPPVSIGIIKTDNGGYENGVFYIATKATNANTAPVERMRITSGGYLKQSYNGTYVGSTLLFNEFSNNQSGEPVITSTCYGSSIADASIYFASFEIDHNNNTAQFFRGRGDVNTRVRLYSNGGIANYQANNVNLSDVRTKKDITPLESYWDKFKSIEIVKFKYKDQTHDDFNIGVIAQQVEKVAPEFIDVDGWGETPEDGIPLKSVYTADLHHATIKVLQEAMTKIETLQTQNDALQSRIETLESK